MSSSELPRVSVIVPAYGHCELIGETLDSVLRQTVQDFEILVVNDGSPDGTKEVLHRYIEAGQIRYYEQTNRGQASARNFGLREARGKYIAFLDDDDIWPKDKLEWQCQILEENPDCLAAVGASARIHGNQFTQRYWPVFPNLCVSTLFTGNPIASPGQTLIRKDILMAIGGFNEQIWGADDWSLWFEICARGKVYVSPRIALFYRVHSNNASSNVTGMFWNARAVLLHNLSRIPAADRSEFRRRAYQTLFTWYGGGFIHAWKTAVRRGDRSAAATSSRAISTFVFPALRDWRLFRSIVDTVCGNKLRKFACVSRSVFRFLRWN